MSLYIVLFNLTYLTVCSIIFYRYGDLSDIISELVAGCSLLITALIFFWFFLSPESFLRFRLSFRPPELRFFHYFLHVLCILLSITLVAFVEYLWAPLIPQGTLLLYTLIARPYELLVENIRSSMNLLVMCGISGFRVYDQYIESRRDMLTFYLILGMEGALLVIIVWAYVSVIKDYVNEYYLKQK